MRNRCELLIEQSTPARNVSGRYDFPNARICRFPALDINLIWPLRADDPRSRPEPPDFPFGRYPYGDRIINQVVADGLSGEAGWQAFQQRTDAALPDIARLARVERKRWEYAERDLDVRMSDVIFPHFVTKRLFWTYNHPHRTVLCRLGARILLASGWAPDEETGYKTMERLLTWDFGADYQAPVHPEVAASLGLEWWSPNMTFRRFADEFQYEEFVRRQIDWV